MATSSNAAPSAFAEAARTTFIYAPIVGVIGMGLVAIGVASESKFPVLLGVAAYLGAAIAGLVGVAGMIREGQHLLARHHEAAGLAIRHYRTAVAATQTGAARTNVVAPDEPTATAPPSSPSTEAPSGDLGRTAATDPASFVALLKSLYILDAARDVQRLYGNETCASFVNRKCADNGMPHVNLTAEDIPAQF